MQRVNAMTSLLRLRFGFSSPAAALLFTLLASVGLSACGSSGSAICAKYAECSADPPGADFQQICETRYGAEIDALNQNDEQECAELANAKLAFDACRSTLTCDDFTEGDLGGECDDEIDDYQDAYEDADNDIGGRAIGDNGAGPYLPGIIPEKCSSWD